MYLISHKKSECYGCTACEQICSHGALKMEPDEDGFIYPVKNMALCTNCGLCEKVCPFGSVNSNNVDDADIYAAFATDEACRKGSSSGAIFYLIARAVIAKGGIVYGAVIDENCQVSHKSAETEEELNRLRGSKYVQSSLHNTYREIRSNLRAGRMVYFVGTGCQVAGLQCFLIKKYDNLLTSDLVCHGVPSQKMFDTHISYLENKRRGKVVKYSFRNNESWGGCEMYTVENDKGKRKKYQLPSYFLSPYLYSFMYAMTYRDSCYECQFASVPRRGDLTLADFWGAEEFYPQLDTSKGVSLVLANTVTGKMRFDELKGELTYVKSDLEKAARRNKNLVTHTIRPEIRDHIFNDLHEHGYDYIAKTKFRPKNYTKFKIKYTLLDIIGRENFLKFKKLIGKF